MFLSGNSVPTSILLLPFFGDFFKEDRQRAWGIPEGVVLFRFCLEILFIDRPASVESWAGVEQMVSVFSSLSADTGSILILSAVKSCQVGLRWEVVRQELVDSGGVYAWESSGGEVSFPHGRV